MKLANSHATRLYHEHIGPGHMLAGLLDEGSGVGVHVLRTLDVDPDLARAEVMNALRPGRPMVTIGRLPMDAAAHRVVAYAIEESALLGHTHVGTEHLLLGLLRERDSEGATALAAVEVTLEQARAGVRAAIQDASNAGWTAEDASPTQF